MNKQAAGRKQERVVFSGVVRQQHAPFYEVHAGGHSIEFTDIRTAAHAAFHDAKTHPKTLTLVDSFGRRTLLDSVR